MSGDSGGPLIDNRGCLVGVTESGRVGAQNVNNCVDLTEVWAFLDEKKITIKDLTGEKDEGPKPKPKVESPPKKENGTENPRKESTSADEKKAAEMLQAARLFKDDEDKTYYKGKLGAIVTKYPDTAAGKEAKKLLDALK